MLKTFARFFIAGTILCTDFHHSKPLSANSLCDTLALKEFVEQEAMPIIQDNWEFWTPLGVDSDILDCEYYAEEDAHLVKANINWSGPLEGRFYESIVAFTVKGSELSSWKLLGASPSLQSHFKENSIIIKGIEALGDSSNSSRDSTNEDYYLVCIRNNTDNEIKFSYQWADQSTWDDYQVATGDMNVVWLSSRTEEKLDFRFDSSFAEGVQQETHTLAPTLSSVQDCTDVPGYYLTREENGDTIFLNSDR